MGEVFVWELADETDIFLYLLPLPLHLLIAVLAAFVLQSLQDVLVFSNYFEQLSFAVGLIQCLLPAFGALLIQTRI